MAEKERMQIIAENITYYRKNKKITQKELAEKIGIKPSTLSDYINLRSAPSFGVIQKLADYFGVKKSDIDTTFREKDSGDSALSHITNFDPRQAILLSNYSKLNNIRKNKLLAISETLLSEEQGKVINLQEKMAEYGSRKRVSLSVPGKVSAGTGYWQEDDYDTEVDFYADEIPDEKNYDTVAVVVGHSMEPKIKNGDFLFIKLADQVDINKIGIFQVNGENYVKKLKNDYLQSLNPKYADITPAEGDDFRTIGEVVDIYREG